jgi:ATP-dependent DNA helicase Q1
VAGRDGARAECVLYYRFSDAMKQAGMVSFELGWEGRLSAMMRYATSASACRRGMIAR